MTMRPISIVILTHNEEQNLSACLDSLSEFEDIHVLDSGSTDSTRAIAESRQIPFYSNPFQGFGMQRNWAIDNITTKYIWQFHIDADERMTPNLAEELCRIAVNSSQEGGYQVPSKLMFSGKWLKWAGQYPAYQVRFFQKGKLRFVNHGHGQRELSEYPIGHLKQPLIHYGFSRGIDAWFIKHVGYARREAEQAISGADNECTLFSLNPVYRRRALKHFASRLPGRYFLRLCYMLFLRMAILDGWTGMVYAHMLATYESMIDVYLRLMRKGVDVNRGI